MKNIKEEKKIPKKDHPKIDLSWTFLMIKVRWDLFWIGLFNKINRFFYCNEDYKKTK